MRQIRETLRLHLQAGLSYNEVCGALKIYQATYPPLGAPLRLPTPRRRTPAASNENRYLTVE